MQATSGSATAGVSGAVGIMAGLASRAVKIRSSVASAGASGTMMLTSGASSSGVLVAFSDASGRAKVEMVGAVPLRGLAS